jgi:hypothetical protein
MGQSIGLALCFGREEVPGAMKQAGKMDYLYGVVKQTKALGVLISMDATDTTLTYKLRFPDGVTDWFPEDRVDLQGEPFKVLVMPNVGRRVEVADLRVNDKLSVLFQKVAQALRQPQSKLVMSCGSKIFDMGDMDRCLGLLGFGEGSALMCTVSNYDPDLLRLEISTERDHSDGEVEIWKLMVLILGRKGSPSQRVLWADYSVRKGSVAGGLDAIIEKDTLSVINADGVTGVYPISRLFAEAKPGTRNGLQDQLQEKFGNHQMWACMLGRLCRRIE